MDALRSAVPLARLLLALADRKRYAAVLVRSGARSARLVLAQGQAVSLAGVDGEPLGDTLLKRGALDAVRHGSALTHTPPQGPVGRWLVEVGAAGEHAVRAALREQLSVRIGRLLTWVAPTFELVPASLLGSDADVQVDVPAAVWAGLVRVASELPPGTADALAGRGTLRLTRSGQTLVRALAAGGAAPAVETALRDEAARSARAVLRALGAAVEHGADGEAYSLLLRKQREIRRAASAATLLDLPTQHVRPDDARRALRKLAHKLHPDRFQADEPRLRAVSSEVMQALSRAEASLRVPPLRRKQG